MFKNIASRVNKFLVVSLSLALALTGLSAVPASAGGVTYSAANTHSDVWTQVNTALTNNELVIPAKVTMASMYVSYDLGSSFLSSNVGKKVTLKVKVTGPNGVLGTVSQGNLGYYSDTYAQLCEANWSNCLMTNAYSSPPIEAKIAANHVIGNIRTNVSIAIPSAEQAMPSEPLPVGKYTLEAKLFVDDTEVTVDEQTTGIKTSYRTGSFNADRSVLVPSDTNSLNPRMTMCVDSTKIAAGDVLTPTYYINDVQRPMSSFEVSYNTRSSDNMNPSYRQGNSVTVTQEDITYGLSVFAMPSIYSPTVGSNYLFEGTFTNQNGTDVTGDCAPTTPAKPTVTVSGSSLTATFPSINFANIKQCFWYLSSDLTTPVKKAWIMPMGPNTPATCTLTGGTPGADYVLRFRGMFGNVPGAFSEASDPIKVPRVGFNVSPAVSGGDDGGQVSVVSNSTASSAGATFTTVIADGKGGTLRLAGTSTSTCPPICGNAATNYKLERTTTTGYVSDFAGTGSVTWSPSQNGSPARASFYGSSDKWTISAVTAGISGNGQTPAQQLEMIQGSYGSATTTSTTVASTVFASTCATLGSGFTHKPLATSDFISIAAVSAPTTKQLFSLNCYKPTTMADNTTVVYLPYPVLVTIDQAGSVAIVAQFGENSGTTNSTAVSYSTNPDAAANGNMLTVFVTKKLVTASSFNQMTAQTVETSTISGREIVRLTPSFSATTATSAWDTGGNTVGSTEPALVIPTVNDGSLYVMQRYPTSQKLMKVSATGAASSPVTITNDKGSDFTMPGYSWPIGLQSGSLDVVSIAVQGSTAATVLSVTGSTGAGKASEVVKFTQASGPGFVSNFIIDSSKDIFWWHSNVAADSGKISIYKWRNPLFVKPVGPVPAVTSKNLDYATDTPANGTKLTFTGTNLNIVTAVKFGSVSATLGTKTATSLEVTVPAGTGTVALSLESTNGNGSGGNFTYVGATKVAQSVAFTSGANTAKVGDADRTLSATASMQGFTADQSITFSSSTPLVCTVVGNKLHFVAAGTCTVKATQAGSGWAAEGSSTANITVSAVVVPTVTAQISGKATNTPAAGTKVTITGTNLDKVTAVKFGNVTATIGVRSATSLAVTVPAGATGTVNVTLVHANGTVTAGTFTYVGATKVAQVVTLTSGANSALVGDADRTLSATVKIGADAAVASLTFSSSTPLVCTVVGTKLKFVTYGTCTVKATQAGSDWSAEGSATASISVRKPQTVTVNNLSAPEKLASVEGVFLYANSTSGGVLTYTSSTPTVCNKGTFGAGHVLNIKPGTCTFVVAQAGDATWAPASATITYTVGAAGTAAIVDPGNVTAPLTLPNVGTKVNVLSEVVYWDKAKGELNVRSRGIWVGPITETATFKVGNTNYTCTQNYGVLKAVTDATANQVKGFAAPNLCTGTSASDKAALAALKGLKASVIVKIVVVRDLRNPSNYTVKGQNTSRTIYVSVG